MTEPSPENPTAADARTRWRFGPAEFDEGTFELRVDGQPRNAERKPLEVLLCLLRHGNEIVTKDQILETVWPGRIVTESVLTKCVAKLREALGDHRQTLIKTQHGQGYRLLVPVRAERSQAHSIERGEPAVAAATELHSQTALPSPPLVPTPAAPMAADGSPRTDGPAPAGVPRPARRRLRVLGVAAAVVLALALALVWLRPSVSVGVLPVAKSVAVLPFASLSVEADNAWFTEGLHDSILTHLALIQDLSVISRTSVLQFRDGARDLRQIAGQLGVAHIVEGSVQRVGDQLRVTAQLIDTRTDTHVWAGQFDRHLSDVFLVQAELAQQIAAAVHAELTPAEKTRIERQPTQSTAAYELYLRALETERSATAERPDIEQAITHVEQAIALDPDFALAYALLSGLHDALYWPRIDASPVRLAQVRDAARAALRLQPDLPEAHIAMGRYLYHGSRDYPAAIEALQQAHALAPGNTEVPFWLGAIYRRQGRWQEAAQHFERAARLDPRNEQALTEYAFTLQALRRYAEADLVYARLEAFAQKPLLIRIKRGYLQFARNGSLERLDQALAGVVDAPRSGCEAAFTRWQVRLYQRRYQEAADAALSCVDEQSTAGDIGAVPAPFFAAVAYESGGDAARARPLYREARNRFERLLQSHDDANTRVLLAYALVSLGETEAARAEAQRALDTMPVSRDAIAGATVVMLASGFYARAGDDERALDLLERALALPSGEHVHAVRLNSAYDTLRALPRYQELIARYMAAPAS